MEIIRISHPTGILSGHIDLERSKSLSNRYLIIRSLCNASFDIKGLANSDDTKILKSLLENIPPDQVYDVHHAGTSFRFLTAYLAIQKGTQILTGSHRMKERPIGPLVTALNQLGCQISYLEREGYPPLKINSPSTLGQTNEIDINADISSQFMSALIMISPRIPGGMTLNLIGDLVSESYLDMTLKTIGQFGIKYTKSGNSIHIEHQEYSSLDVEVEADWSASSYYFACAALSKTAEIQISGLFENSIQGDSAMTSIGKNLGVHSKYENNRLCLTKGELPDAFSYDFINQPDLAQTVAVVCAANTINAEMTGLKTLRIKETDRISALDAELKKVSSGFIEHPIGSNGYYYTVAQSFGTSSIPRFSTYHDHRMAMAFAPLSLKFPIEIEDPAVVSKSYPGYWRDLESLGFEIMKVES